jgi:predicted acylesterase/phospholipase RssA
VTAVRIGVALSGGGHRASAWGTGVLAAVVDAGVGADVVSVSSVSGGSITNGVVAQNLDLRTATPDQFDAAVRSSLVNYALVGLFPKGPLTKGYFRLLIVSLVVAILAVVALLAAFVAAAASWINGAVAVVTLGVLGVVTVGAWGLFWVLLARRGSVVRSAIARTHFGGDRRSLGTPLAGVDRPVNHVFLTTDLEAGDQFYLSPRFLYGFREGIADPATAGTALADAVQASAALPGAFPAVRLHTGPFRRPWNVPGGVPQTPPERVVLSDGGVYDNMADQWESGIADRIRRWPELGEIQQPADVLIVANSSAGWGWAPFDAKSWPKREVTALMRNQGVQYDVSTSRRRQAIVQTWMDNERTGAGQSGVIVMIDRSPYIIADGFAADPGPRGARAKEAIEFLGDSSDARAAWAQRASSNASVPTVLGAIGVDATLDLMEHAYTSTLVGLYVIAGLGALRPFDRSRFAALLR